MCYQLTTLAIDGVTAADLEMMLTRLGIDCLADTISQHWSADERLDVFHWASATIASQRVQGLLVPPVPDVLAPFIEASQAVEAANRVRLVKLSEGEEFVIDPQPLPLGSLGTIVEGTMAEPGMLLIKWDRGDLIPMFRSELEAA